MKQSERQDTTTHKSQTTEHYNAHPFDFMDGINGETIDKLQPAAFQKFVQKYLLPSQSVVDVGCGPGRDLMYLRRFGLRLTGVDVSEKSLAMAQQRVPGASFCRVSNLAMPFADGNFDAVISDGVIHHTPDPHGAFLENGRILREGGHMYVAVYRRWRYYYYIYTYVGRPVRWLVKRRLGRAIIHSSLLPLYFLAHLVKSRGKRSWYAAKNLFYDYIITPQASFHTKEEIVKWGLEAGLTLIDYDEKGLGNCHAFTFKKRKNT